MKREMKIVLIVFGSLFALLIVAAIVVVAIGSRMASTIARGQNPETIRRTAAKIATFELPKGYRFSSSTDFGLQQTVTIVRDTPGRRAFTMQLQGSTIPSDSKSTGEGMSLAMSLAARVVRCETHASTDTIALRSGSLALRELTCDGKRSLRIETGVFPHAGHTLTVIATGFDGTFDRDALVALLRSLR